jgi:hypothetical protein
MTGPEHYQEAEQLLRSYPEAGTAVVERRIARAQVHAILALAAATALHSVSDSHAWAEVAGIKLPGG